MNAVTRHRAQEDWEHADEPQDELPARRPRRQLLNRRSAALAALATCAAGFYAGVRVEKGQLAGSTGSSTLAAPAGAGRPGAAGGGRPGAAGVFSGGGANASFGTVASVNGKTVYVTETSGNTVKVRLSASTKITKSQSVSRAAVRPGDTVVVTGVPNSSGVMVAASLTDTGAGRAAAGSSTGSGAGSGGSRSAVGSLFSPGG